jgi:hypothetical protein
MAPSLREDSGVVPRLGSKFADIHKEVRSGLLPESSVVVRAWTARVSSANRSLVTRMFFASVLNAILVFILRKSRLLLRTSTIRVAGPMATVNLDRIGREVSLFASLFDHRREIAVGRRDNSHIDLDCPRTSQPLEFAFLQNAP